jgi:hypothetical protein
LSLIKLSEFGTTLGTRKIGKNVLEMIAIEYNYNKRPVEISFENVFMVSSSFADECFGSLIESIGQQEFKKSFVVTGLDNYMIKSVLNAAVRNRLNIQMTNPLN